MPEQVTSYRCPACSAPLFFDSATGRLTCEYCKSSYTPQEVEAFYAQQDAQAAAAFQGGEAQAAGSGEPPELLSKTRKAQLLRSRWDESTIAADWGEEKENLRAFVCDSCGSELLCDASTAATQCPYCGNPTIVPGQVGGALRPDCIIPFKLDKKDAVAAMKKHLHKRPFLPRTFSSGSQIKKIQGVYVPFWLFHSDAAAECWYEGTNSRTRREGDYRITVTDHYDVRRFGTVRFDRVPTDASQKMPDALMDCLEPFDYNALVPFSTAYLPGYLAHKYDVTVKEDGERADERCANTTKELMRRDVTGYQSVTSRREDIYLDRRRVEYALLPVWTLHVTWQDRNYLFAMNGQTGKFVGDLPVDKGRFWRFCLGLTAALAAVFYATGIGPAIARFILT